MMISNLFAPSVVTKVISLLFLTLMIPICIGDSACVMAHGDERGSDDDATQAAVPVWIDDELDALRPAEILDKVRDRYQRLATYKASMNVLLTKSEARSTEATATIAYESQHDAEFQFTPLHGNAWDQYTLQFTDASVVLQHDGHTTVSRWDDMEDPVWSALAGMHTFMDGFMPYSFFLVCANEKIISSRFEFSSTERLPDERILGHDCITIRASPKGGFPEATTFYVCRQTGLLRRTIQKWDMDGKEHIVTATMRSIEYTEAEKRKPRHENGKSSPPPQ